MAPSSDAWLDPLVGADALRAVRAHLEAGARRVLLWGPPGVGRSTLLRRLAEEAEAAEEAERPDAVLVDARGPAEAARALARAEGPTVVASVTRAGLEADAYVELAPLPLDDGSESSALAFLLRLRARDGAPDPSADARAALRRLVAHADGRPGALRRAADLLRVLDPEALCARCEEAERALLVFGQRLEHPLHPEGDGALVEAWGADLRAAAIRLFATGEPLEPAAAEAWLADEERDASEASPLDRLLALRDRGAVRVEPDGRLAVPAPIGRALARAEAFEAIFPAAAARWDGRVVAEGRAARARWLERGDPEALERLAAHEGRLRRAAERALRRADGDPAARAHLVDLVLALRTRGEVQEGARAHEALLNRALEVLGDDPAAGPLQLERAQSLRLAGDFAGAERALARLDPEASPEETAARWYAEQAHVLRHRRELDAAFAHMERACALADALGWAHQRARDEVHLGSIRFWQERIDDALERFEHGRALAARLGARRTEAIALCNACLCHGLAGDEAAALDAGERAVELLRAVGDSGALGTTIGHLGILAFQYGRLDDAERCFREAEARVEEAGYLDQLTFARFNRAEVALAAGRLEEARALARSVEAMVAEKPAPLVSCHLAALEADRLELEGRLPEALATLDRGYAQARAIAAHEARAQLGARRARVRARLGEREASREAAEETRAALGEVTRAELVTAASLALAHAAHLRGEGEGADEALAAALRPAWEGVRTRARVGVSAADSWAVRQAAQAYWRDLPAEARVAVEWAARDPDEEALCLDEASETARAPGGARLDAAARRNAHRLVRLLAAAGPQGCTREALIRELWPGERIQPAAARNRLHNALAQVRAAGLAEALVRDGERYRLDPTLRVIRAGRDDPFAPRRAAPRRGRGTAGSDGPTGRAR